MCYIGYLGGSYNGRSGFLQKIRRRDRDKGTVTVDAGIDDVDAPGRKNSASANFDGQTQRSLIDFAFSEKRAGQAEKVSCGLRKSFSRNLLGNSVTVARLTLDQLVEVRILVPQF